MTVLFISGFPLLFSMWRANRITAVLHVCETRRLFSSWIRISNIKISSNQDWTRTSFQIQYFSELLAPGELCLTTIKASKCFYHLFFYEIFCNCGRASFLLVCVAHAAVHWYFTCLAYSMQSTAQVQYIGTIISPHKGWCFALSNPWTSFQYQLDMLVTLIRLVFMLSQHFSPRVVHSNGAFHEFLFFCIPLAVVCTAFCQESFAVCNDVSISVIFSSCFWYILFVSITFCLSF